MHIQPSLIPGQASSRIFESGITACWSTDADVPALVDIIRSRLTELEASCCLLFYSPSHIDHEVLNEAMNATLPDNTPVVGCSSSGEVTPDGLHEGGVVALLLPRQYFTVSTIVLEDINHPAMDDTVGQVQVFLSEFGSMLQQKGIAQADDFTQVFAVSLIDGLCYSEESVTAALHRGLGDIPLVGGSAGDNLQFERTTQLSGDRNYTRSAVLTLIHSQLPFKVFSNNTFAPTEHKLVVTESNPEYRNVSEFNAMPAAVAYASAIGLDVDALTPSCFANHPLVVRVGGEYYCRSIQKCEEDQSLTFFCAIDNGIVLTVAKSTDIAKSLEDTLACLRESLGDIEMILGFDCVLRRLDATGQGTAPEVSSLYVDANIIGFGTYGEQYYSMHINQTLTGIAFGKPTEQ